jgi:hypothetical protein
MSPCCSSSTTKLTASLAFECFLAVLPLLLEDQWQHVMLMLIQSKLVLSLMPSSYQTNSFFVIFIAAVVVVVVVVVVALLLLHWANAAGEILYKLKYIHKR